MGSGGKRFEEDLEDYFLYTGAGISVEVSSLAYFVINGAWDKDSRRGATAWVQDRVPGEALYQTAVCDASSATMVEIRAGLLLHEWAVNRQLVNVCVRTDFLVFDSLFVVFFFLSA
ncbi:hypothetical protein RHGRI_013533 [Rhododendron griersonianum]|uniref:Uncharacterized protein n=1 Tax=Rhododendron griersonianum TaxID=479676 RepID=A0AAV6K5Y6_9ERIC|nr:hypothetical protein RHGRI_013533 [Rhododendron griersonianum]